MTYVRMGRYVRGYDGVAASRGYRAFSFSLLYYDKTRVRVYCISGMAVLVSTADGALVPCPASSSLVGKSEAGALGFQLALLSSSLIL